MLDLETGKLVRHRLLHGTGEAKAFYETLQGPVVVGIEASGNTLWFERLLAQLGHELWMGDATKIRREDPRKQKHDRRDAARILKMMMEKRFPKVWIPTMEERDLRQLLMHRHRLVRMRKRVKNQLQHIALNQGLQKKYKLWTEAGRKLLRELELEPWTRLRRDAARDAGRAGAENPASGAGGGRRSRISAGSTIAGFASWSRPGDCLGHSINYGRGSAVR
jgi:transposase